MPTLKINHSLSTIILFAILVALVGYQTFGNHAGPIQPAIIATFDLEKTFNALEEKKQAFDDLVKTAEGMQAKGEEQSKALKQMNEDLKDLVEGAPKFRELMAKLAEGTQNYRAYMDYCKLKIDSERARALKRIYLDIRHAVEQMANENHYSVVFVDDSIALIPVGTEEETNRQISARRIVYTSPEVDITDELISRMNKAYKPPIGAASQPASQPSGKPASGAASADKPKQS